MRHWHRACQAYEFKMPQELTSEVCLSIYLRWSNVSKLVHSHSSCNKRSNVLTEYAQEVGAMLIRSFTWRPRLPLVDTVAGKGILSATPIRLDVINFLCFFLCSLPFFFAQQKNAIPQMIGWRARHTYASLAIYFFIIIKHYMLIWKHVQFST